MCGTEKLFKYSYIINAFTLAYLLPRNVISETTTWELVKPAFDKYIDVLRCELPNISEELVKAEFKVWAAMCRGKPHMAHEVSAISAVNKCSADALPAMHSTLTILAILPVCTAEAENILQSGAHSDVTTQQHVRRKT